MKGVTDVISRDGLSGFTLYLLVWTLSVIFCLTDIAMAQEKANNNMLLYMKFDTLNENENKEVCLQDESFYANECRLLGEGYSLIDGIDGKALLIDGRKNAVSLPYARQLDLKMATGFTVQFWFRPSETALQAGDVHRWVLFGNKVDTSPGGYVLQYRVAQRVFVFSFASEDRFKPVVIESVALPVPLKPNEWYHFAVTGREGKINFFLNGAGLSSKESIVGEIPPLRAGVRIGTYRIDRFDSIAPFIGAIDEFKVEAIARSDFPEVRKVVPARKP